MENNTNWVRIVGFRTKRLNQVPPKLKQLTSHGYNVRPIQIGEYYYVEKLVEETNVSEGDGAAREAASSETEQED